MDERPRPPSVAQLKALVALADTLNFREAAARLAVSQPAVSAAVAGLEANLGVPVVERSTRRVALTAAGNAVVAHARDVLLSLDKLVSAAEHDRRPFSGPLRLGVIPTVAPYMLPFVLRTLARRFPSLRPDVKEDQTAHLLDQLGSGDLDLLLLALPSGGSGVSEIPLYDEDFVLLVAENDPLAGKSRVDPTVLRRLRLLLLEEGHCLRDQALDLCRQVGAATDHPARATSLTTLSRLVAANLGTTLLPASATSVEVRRGLATATFRPPAPGRRIGLVYREGTSRAGEYEQIADRLRSALRATSLPVRPREGE
jgi:LysR family hydrogen peroxide-inducible transcriptional activator